MKQTTSNLSSKTDENLFNFIAGHVIRCYGENYTSLMDNGPAWRANLSKKIAEAGETCGEPCEVTLVIMVRARYKFCFA